MFIAIVQIPMTKRPRDAAVAAATKSDESGKVKVEDER
jgi:hypothetical protein